MEITVSVGCYVTRIHEFEAGKLVAGKAGNRPDTIIYQSVSRWRPNIAILGENPAVRLHHHLTHPAGTSSV